MRPLTLNNIVVILRRGSRLMVDGVVFALLVASFCVFPVSCSLRAGVSLSSASRSTIVVKVSSLFGDHAAFTFETTL